MKTGVLLINLGTPKSYSKKDVAPYLREFLMDPYVIDKPWLLRFFLVNALIIPVRTKNSSLAYQKVWTDRGSPFLFHTSDLEERLQENLGENFIVKFAMRYGEPSIPNVLKKFDPNEIDKLLVLPLYPQYAESSTRTALEVVEKNISAFKNVHFLKPFYKEPKFIQAYTALIQEQSQSFKPDHLLMSFHGLPERHILKTDPECEKCLTKSICTMRDSETCYRSQSFQTANELALSLGLTKDQYSVSFQSRLGKDPWIKPYTDEIIKDLVQKGVKKLQVVCPAFAADCLETIEEIGIALKSDFLELGGEDFCLTPCLNSHSSWVNALAFWIQNESDHLWKVN